MAFSGIPDDHHEAGLELFRGLLGTDPVENLQEFRMALDEPDRFKVQEDYDCYMEASLALLTMHLEEVSDKMKGL